MQFDNGDLEKLLQHLMQEASNVGIKPPLMKRLYQTAIQKTQKEKKESIQEFYSGFNPSAYYVESFQHRVKRKSTHENLPEKRVVWQEVRGQINTVFGTELDTYNRGDNQVFVWVESMGPKAILHCYGNAHGSWTGRQNAHYFGIVDNLDNLERIALSFIQDPSNMDTFNEIVFGWKNEDPINNPGVKEPALYSRMNQLHVHTSEGFMKVTY